MHICKDAVSLSGVDLQYFFRWTTENKLYAPNESGLYAFKLCCMRAPFDCVSQYHEAGITQIASH